LTLLPVMAADGARLPSPAAVGDPTMHGVCGGLPSMTMLCARCLRPWMRFVQAQHCLRRASLICCRA